MTLTSSCPQRRLSLVLIVVRARTLELKVRVPSRSFGLIDSIGWLLSITVGHISPGQGIDILFFFATLSGSIEASPFQL